MEVWGKNKFYDILNQLTEFDLSDIHITEWKEPYVRLSNGVITKASWVIVNKEDIYWFLQDILSPNKIDELLNWREIDTAYQLDSYRFRINAYLSDDWINLALRKINQNIPEFKDIWLPEWIKEHLKKDRWLILVTWPTWSWKSTTLATMIEYINQTRSSHIITLEDPIEFKYVEKKALIHQREIWKHSKSWKDAIKYALRQDPDVIMVGEMRDIETISSVLTLVETWHLVLSTLHTIDAAQTISRIIDVFPPHQQDQIAVQLSTTLDLVISQRLIKRKDWKWRVAAREILVNTTAVANNIREKKIPQIYSIMETWSQYWMTTMDKSLAELVARWIIDIQEALPKVKNIETFKIILNSYHGWKFVPKD